MESRNREQNCIHKILSVRVVSPTTYIEDIMGLSGRNLLQLLVDGRLLIALSINQATPA